MIFMEEVTNKTDLLFDILKDRGTLHCDLEAITKESFGDIKSVLMELELELKTRMNEVDDRVTIQFVDKAPHEADLRISSDVVVFIFHTNIFTFEPNHSIWKSSYVSEDPRRGKCGMISIYNFLTDSFKYQRVYDVGYLVGRIFINHEKHFFVEGKRQLGFLFNRFETDLLSMERTKDVVQMAILQSLDFEIFTPPFNAVEQISLGMLEQKNLSESISIGKRLGFKYQVGDEDVIHDTDSEEDSKN